MEQSAMIAFDRSKLDPDGQNAWDTKLDRDGWSSVNGQWADIVARVEGLRCAGLTDGEIFVEVSKWELDPIWAMINQAIEGTAR
jgi:hypothetical protein